MACGLTAGRRGEQKPGISKYPQLRRARIGWLDLQSSHSTITPATYLWWFRGCYQIFPGVGIVVAGMAGLLPWIRIAVALFPLVVFHSVVGLIFRGRVNRMIESLRSASLETRVL